MAASFQDTAGVKHGGQDRFQRLPHAVAAAWQGNDEGLSDGACDGLAHHGQGRALLTIDTHRFGNAGSVALEQLLHGAHRTIARTAARTTCCKNKMDVFASPLAYLLLDSCFFIGNDGVVLHAGIHSDQHLPDELAALVLSLTRIRGIRTHEHGAGGLRVNIPFPVALSSLFLQQTDMADLKGSVHRLEHIVDLKRSDAYSGKHLHLDTGPADRARLAKNEGTRSCREARCARRAATASPHDLLMGRRPEPIKCELHAVDRN